MERQTVRSISKQTAVKRKFSPSLIQEWVVDVKMTQCFLKSCNSFSGAERLLVKAWGQTLNISACPHRMGNVWCCNMSERCGHTKHAWCDRLTLLQPSGLLRVNSQWGMLVTDSSMSGSSYRSGVTFSGQGRLKDILAWDKAQGLVNLRYKKLLN